ncbi:olfactomedin-like protein 3B [Denticeps clupeoides]|uniref:Olfactomedin-like domain-containing protein n=1 Tax=Denticeps clupeoides TaxID=299321 RepID=A0AAY4BCX8_9TELE|nr:olfactomedin-like protein 3B [Denticeps clupeoides]
MRVFISLFLLISSTRLHPSWAQYHYQGLMNYLENRMQAMEERISVWQEQAVRYGVDLKEFRQQAADVMERLARDHDKLRQELDSAGGKVERMEREMDYIETKNPPPPCSKAEDKMVEQKPMGKMKKTGELRGCMDLVFSIKAMKILKRMGSPKGTWTRDSVTAKVYAFNGTADDTLYEFSSVRALSSSSDPRAITLPVFWNGTGHTVHNGQVYYVTEGSELRVMKYDLQNDSMADSAVFPVDDHSPVFSLNQETIVDLVADEEGLWALYGSKDKVSLARMDANTLDIEQMWDTSCPRENAESAFMVCGTLYVVYNSKPPSRSRIQCVFDVNDMVNAEEAPLLYFPRRYGTHSSIKYNPHEKQLYAWDDGYQILYKLSMKKKGVFVN